MPSRKISVLAVDDDVRLLRLMQRILEIEGHKVLRASSGEEALDIFFDEETPDLVLLDVMMSGIDGFTTCQRIREFSQVPVIIVTAKGNEDEKVEGLNAGADDYITKPFSSKELVARVKAVLRRTKFWEDQTEPAFTCDDLTIDYTQHSVSIDKQDITLTATEYRLLAFLAHNAGRVVTPDQILEKVWGADYIGEAHLLQVNVARLRQKLSDSTKTPKYITTRPGIGYIMKKNS
ncbi:MAG: response regulator transcription factor [Chloroflexi bacterium]|jgi:DNA-binding response OmpR family regulator|nr:response regulator transcription factor [Chloroflexota bacterium]MBT7081092.1 response regulator transcription factor [Chloroflexota bacterium]MBT7289471.1 response regulator transcription factor [Chloroflexota bacterium]